MDEADACAQIATTEYPAACSGCDPTASGRDSPPPSPPPPPTPPSSSLLDGAPACVVGPGVHSHVDDGTQLTQCDTITVQGSLSFGDHVHVRTQRIQVHARALLMLLLLTHTHTHGFAPNLLTI